MVESGNTISIYLVRNNNFPESNSSIRVTKIQQNGNSADVKLSLPKSFKRHKCVSLSAVRATYCLVSLLSWLSEFMDGESIC